MEHGKCRSCGAEIIWIRSAATGSLMPLDAEPVEGGNVVVKDGMAHVMRGDLFEEMLDGPCYQSHYVTCPQAAKWRKAK